MKRTVLSAFVCSLCVLSCTLYIPEESREKVAPPPPQSQQLPMHSQLHSTPALERNWKIIEFQKFTKEKLTESNAGLNLIPNPETGQFGANFGCNTLFFTVTERPENKIEFSHIGSTMMYCEGKMELEMEAAKFLQDKLTYSVQGHFLELTNNKGEKMRFVAEDWD